MAINTASAKDQRGTKDGSPNLKDIQDYFYESVFRHRPDDYLKSYPKWPGQVGLEVEMLPFLEETFDTERPKLAPLYGANSLSEALISLAQQHRWTCKMTESGHLLGIEVPGEGNISFEPGGQLEFSSLPFPCLTEAIAVLERNQRRIDQHLAEQGIRVLQHGINPWQTVDEIGLQMTKPRYQAMDGYFQSIGPYGRRMMRQTCTLQVNLDFGATEMTMAKRFVVANLIAPFATAIFAYSPYVNRALSGQRSARAEAWRHIDHSRSGLVGLEAITSSWTRRACSDAYAKRVLAAPVIFVEALDFERPDVSFSFEHWITNPYKGVRPTFKDLETHLSLFFPEVRARGFAELRSMDCPSRVWQTVPALFYTALLYANDALEACVQRLLPYVSQLPALLEESGRKALELPVIRKEAEWLMRLAMDSATSLPGCFHGEQSRAVLSAYAERFTMAGRSPADEVIEIAMRHGGKFLPSHCLQLEAEWARMLE